MNPTKIQDLIATARAGNPKPIYRFFLSFYGKCLKSLMAALNISQETAKECFAEAKYQFWKKFVWGDAKAPQNVEGYIYIAARNYYLDTKKKNKAYSEELDVHSVEQFLAIQDDKEHDPLIAKENASELSEMQKQQILAVDEAQKRLSPTCQKLITASKIKKIKLDTLVEQFHFKSKAVLKVKISQCWKNLKTLAKEIYGRERPEVRGQKSDI